MEVVQEFLRVVKAKQLNSFYGKQKPDYRLSLIIKKEFAENLNSFQSAIFS